LNLSLYGIIQDRISFTMNMNYSRLNTDWNAEPNAPQVKISIDGTTITLEFFLNYFMYEKFKEGDKCMLKFKNCHKYSSNGMNDEGYYRGQYRYKYTELPWGEFYKLDTDWEVDFPAEHIVLSAPANTHQLNHYIFFFRDNTFECVAESYELEFLRAIPYLTKDRRV
jgi:hypothetical protein